MVKQVYIGIFAHPDDESFGPSGSLYTYIQQGADVHLISATTGQSGINLDNHQDLGAIRYKEWLTAGKILGARSQHCLERHDGELSNNAFHAIANEVNTIVKTILNNYKDDAVCTLVTFEPNGISGHIDHIVMSNITSYVFETLHKKDTRIHDVHYYCISENEVPQPSIDYVYMPRGKRMQEISFANDISDVFDIKKRIMRAHVSQRNDAEDIIARFEKMPVKNEYFIRYPDR